jgi:DNA polymerase-3 subunit gamma/tau
MLDQMASAGAASIDAEAVRQHLGLVSAPELAALLAAAARGDAAVVLREIERQAQRGADLRQLANGLAEMARKAVLISLGAADAAELGLDAASGAALTSAVGSAGREFAAAAFEAALAASTEMKQTHDPRLLLELLLLRLASGRDGSGPGTGTSAGTAESAAAGDAGASKQKPGVGRAAGRAKAATGAGDGAKPEVVAASSEADGAIAEAVVVSPAAGEIEVADAGPTAADASMDSGIEAPAAHQHPPVAPEVLEDIVRGWPLLFEKFKGTGPGVRVRALLKEAGPLDLAGDMLTIGFPYAIFSEKAQEPLNRQELERVLSEVYGQAFRLTFQTVSAERLRAVPAAGPSRPDAPGGAPSAGDGPSALSPGEGSGEGVVQAAQKILGARITDVRPRRRGEAGTQA